MRAVRLVVLVAFFAGCGVKKSTHQKALDQVKLLEGQLSDEKAQNEDLQKRVTVLDADLTKVKADLDALASGKQLSDEEVARIKGEKEATEAELKQLREQRDAQEKRLAAYRDLQARFKQLVATGALEVQFRNGQMTLKLPSGVLFPSGSADLSKEGKATLAKVTEVLLAFKDRRFLVAGHTDNVPIKTKAFPNNWYLSSARAVSVLEFMVGAGFPADKLAAAGYADKDPVGDNGTPAGKEQNRRIEIILVPDLSELPQLAEDPA
jgi:chemotaxis protein MotB